MAQGLTYASGTLTILRGKPASAFSKGDILMLDSTSSLSRIAETFASGVDIAGVADADSNQSISNEVPYIVPESDTIFRASLATNASAVTPGVECDLLHSLANGRAYVQPSSANSVRFVITRGTAGPLALPTSVESVCEGKLIYHAGNLELA
jgi:hypothetical protein